MRILFLHPDYHSGGTEIAGNWPLAWMAYLSGALKAAGYGDNRFVDAMTNYLDDEQVRAILAKEQPDVIGCTAITPSIYKAQQLLKIAKETCPRAVTVLGGIHATFMYQRVLAEAPWIDAIVRGEGEEILAFCEELIARDLKVLWGINTRVTDILRDESLPLTYREAASRWV